MDYEVFSHFISWQASVMKDIAEHMCLLRDNSSGGHVLDTNE